MPKAFKGSKEAMRRIHPILESIENWAGGPCPQSLVTLSKDDFEKLLKSTQRVEISSCNGNPYTSQGQLSREECTDDTQDDQPQDLSISRAQSQPELRNIEAEPLSRPLTKMEQKQLQWQRERAELQAMQNWGPPSMVGSPYRGRRLQPVATITPQLTTNGSRVTNILNMENSNHVQFTDHQGGQGITSPTNRFSAADEAKKRLGCLGSDVADPEVLRLERAQKAAEYRKAIELQVEEKRLRKLEEEMRIKREEEVAERKLQEERDKLRKQYEEEQRKIRMKEEAEERTRQILLEKVKEAEATAEAMKRSRLHRNMGAAQPKDEIIAASVQNALERTQSNLSSPPPLPAPRRSNSGFLATSSNMPSAKGERRSQLNERSQTVEMPPLSQTIIQQHPVTFPAAAPQVQQIYSSAFMEHGEPYMLHNQVPVIHKCQAYVESMPSPPRTGYSTCSCQQPTRLPFLTSFSTQTPSYIENRVLTPTKFRQRSQSLKSVRNSAVQTEWTMYRHISPPSTAPSSPIQLATRQRKTTSTTPVGRKENGRSRRPPWNANIPNHAYVKNTDRDPNMHTRKKLQELRKQHWQREMDQQSAWQHSTRQKIASSQSNVRSKTERSPAMSNSRASSRAKSREYTPIQNGDTSDTDLSVINNDTASDLPDHNGYNSDRVLGQRLVDDGVDSSEVSATASATPGLILSNSNAVKNSPVPAPAPRKTWKSQSMYIPNIRAESPPVPALLNKMRQQHVDDINLNTTRESNAMNNDESLNMSHASSMKSTRQNDVSATSSTIRKTRSHSSVDTDDVNDQRKILSQLSALRQTLLIKRQELENTISTPRMARKAKT